MVIRRKPPPWRRVPKAHPVQPHTERHAMKGIIYVNITTEDGELLDRFRVEAVEKEAAQATQAQRLTYALHFYDNDGDETDHSELESQVRIRARQQLKAVR